MSIFHPIRKLIRHSFFKNNKNLKKDSIRIRKKGLMKKGETILLFMSESKFREWNEGKIFQNVRKYALFVFF